MPPSIWLAGVVGLLSGSTFQAQAEPISLSPPMGWRSWNALGHDHGEVPTALALEETFAAMTNRSRKVDGAPTSLADLGYTRASVDGKWPACMTLADGSCDCGGVNGSYHDANGHPVVNLTSFPNVTDMVAKGHAAGLTVGWYTNNIECNAQERGWSTTPALHQKHYEGVAAWLAKTGFDEIKVDSGGEFGDFDAWQRVLNGTGRPIALENCHAGPLPNASWCPYTQWRTGGDPDTAGWQNEMMSTAAKLSRARRGCWAYPGYAIWNGPGQGMAPSDVTGWRASFGAHAIVSSPLILSFDVRPNSNALDALWPVVANKEAIAVNQNWAGSVGTLVKTWNPQEENASSPEYVWGVACNDTAVARASWVVDPATGRIRTTDGRCLTQDLDSVAVTPCNGTEDPRQRFRWNRTSGTVKFTAVGNGGKPGSVSCIRIHEAYGADVAGPMIQLQTCYPDGFKFHPDFRFNFTADGRFTADRGSCIAAKHGRPSTFGPLQLWSKPQPGGAAAVLVLSIGSTWGNHPQDVPSVTVNLAKIAGLANPAGKFKVRDIWNHADLPAASGGELITGPIKGGDSAFFLITPA